MASRPCKPDNDLKGLWRMVFGTPFPACGMPEETGVANGDNPESAPISPSNSEPRAEAGCSDH
ncbi:MAG TPA: hypothetical protein VK825_06620 [Xanthobacteraceae bacterium]|jgi:hypothetical protein|nr:hypothetical protein [Xanthobacteraceae bacterium]